MFVRDEAEVASRVSGVEWGTVYFSKLMSRYPVLEKFRVHAAVTP